MFFNFGMKNKTVKELRKDKMYTAKELAAKLNISTSLILKVDYLKLKDVPEPLKSSLIMFFED
ncbi:transcriptional regulator [Petroclostridium sp. X23]|uniref:transcriptional regulator n=1 Tax=Petroclostridium sp. X23 TaxID=3045146 RepID=UPI0024AD27F9|nr:transcriptional regulator [Petroclostridium sp. X23]WHH59587.1 transcriptional regulator [Petroclostridium sp. X23]